MRVAVLCPLTILLSITGGSTMADLLIPSPSNVTVICRNFDSMVYWNYSALTPDTIFKLQVWNGNGDNGTNQTKQQRYNISALLGNTLANKYHVEVKAVDGTKESENAKSPKFSFNKYHRGTDLHCQLDFPPVEMYIRSGQLRVRFHNPLHLYRYTPALRNLNWDAAIVLNYKIVTDNKVVLRDDLTCDMGNELCEGTVPLSEEREQYCVTLNGQIKDTDVSTTGKICGDLHTSSITLVFIVIPVAMIAVVLIVVVRICIKKTKPTYTLPKTLASKLKPSKTPWIMNLEEENLVANLSVESAITPPTPLVIPEDGLLLDVSTNDGRDADCLPIGPELISGNLEAVDVPEVTKPWTDTSPVGSELEQEWEMSTDVLSSEYDRPHVLYRHEITTGEFVEGYGQNG